MQADNQNFKMRVEREKWNTIFFLKNDILKKILPRIDDLERIVKNTSQENQTWSLYEWVISIEKALKKDLENLWVKAFDSIWKEINPDMHEVITQIPSDTPGIIVEEFEKWYMLNDRILRVAKVIVWASL
jgi:molecular chaperone GrpE